MRTVPVTIRYVIDWRMATMVAQGIAATSRSGNWTAFASPAAEAAESVRRVSEYTGLVASSPVPVGQAVTRATWVEANLDGLRGVLDPISDRIADKVPAMRGAMNAGAGTILAIEIGVLSGYLSQRVLGQYEFPVLDTTATPRLMFVGPNIASTRERFDADAEDLMRWIALHEVTHALQFGAVSWLRPFIADTVRELLSDATLEGARSFKLPELTEIPSLLRAVKEGGLPALVVKPAQRETLARMQNFMAVIEGYAEHVMDVVGAEVIPTLPQLRKSLDEKRRDRTGPLRLLEKLMGLELKLRQYQEGKAFCDGVVERAGIAGLNRVWAGPDFIPTSDELKNTEAWLARTAPKADLPAPSNEEPLPE